MLEKTGDRYRVKRRHQVRTEERSGYLRSRRAGESLCQVLGERSGMSWLTFVLGSGAIEHLSQEGPRGRDLAERVGDLFEDRQPGRGPTHATLAQRFTESLIENRLGSVDSCIPVPRGSDDAFSLEPLAGPFVLASCLLTQLFHHVRAATPVASSRWDDDEVSFDRNDPPAGAEHVLEDLVAPAARELAHALELLDAAEHDGRMRAPVAGLLRTVLGRLGDHGHVSLSLHHIRLVTELAWHYLLGGASLHPGWSDLLLRLMLTGADSMPDDPRSARPRFLNVKPLGELIEAALGSSLQHAWDLRWSAGPAREPGVHDTVAGVLWAQAAMLTDLDHAARVAEPAASVFVTSFDLEMEMALWASSPGRPFSVVVPVHLSRHRDDDEAALCWLVAEVPPLPPGRWPKAPDALRQPHHWRLLHSNSDAADIRRGPVVVRLTGSPLVALPDLDAPENAALRADLARFDLLTSGGVLTHAVTLDEYIAVRQSQAELRWLAEDEPVRERRRSRALPLDLSADSSTRKRFWAVLGVPFADPAVRHRLVSQLAGWRADGRRATDEDATVTTGPAPADDDAAVADGAPEVDPMTGLPRRRPAVRPAPAGPPPTSDADALQDPTVGPGSDVQGFAVNKRVEEAEASVLHWLGLDVVRGRVEEFRGDFEHYARHVAQERLAVPIGYNESCRLLEESRAR